MTHGTFVWSDLSALDLDKARAFYQEAFGWTYSEESNGYLTAKTEQGAHAGLYTMPDRFQQLGMPSFWMSYISVDDVDTAIERAIASSGKAEIKPSGFPENGRFALTRDPLGAGFTVFERPQFTFARGRGIARRAFALHVSDAADVMSFYEALFGWSFDWVAPSRWSIGLHGKKVAGLLEIPDQNLRGQE